MAAANGAARRQQRPASCPASGPNTPTAPPGRQSGRRHPHGRGDRHADACERSLGSPGGQRRLSSTSPAAARLAPEQLRAAALVLLGLFAVSAYLRTNSLGESLWMDEGLSIGIASQPLLDIPAILRMDGSPPLYYMLLSVWMDLVGDGPAETQALSVAVALLAIPGGLWAGWSLFGRRAGLFCAAMCAVNPFLTAYAQETRMYALMLVMSLLATAAFLHVFAFGRRRYLPLFMILLARDALHAQLGPLPGRRPRARADPVLVRVRGPLELLEGRADRLRRRRPALPAVGSDAAPPGAAHGRALAQPAELRRAGADHEVAARRRHADRRAGARGRLRHRGDPGPPRGGQGAHRADRRAP